MSYDVVRRRTMSYRTTSYIVRRRTMSYDIVRRRTMSYDVVGCRTVRHPTSYDVVRCTMSYCTTSYDVVQCVNGPLVLCACSAAGVPQYYYYYYLVVVTATMLRKQRDVSCYLLEMLSKRVTGCAIGKHVGNHQRVRCLPHIDVEQHSTASVNTVRNITRRCTITLGKLTFTN